MFSVERYIRGKWICDDYETLIQAPMPAQVIDKGIPTAESGNDREIRPPGKSSAVPALLSHAQPWPAGWALAAYSCSHWSMSRAKWSLSTMWCTSMKPRCRCSLRARRKRIELTFGPMPRQPLPRSARRSFSSSRSGGHARSFLKDWKRQRSATILVARRPVFHSA